MKKKTQQGCLGIVVLGVLIAIIAGIAASCGGGKSTADDVTYCGDAMSNMVQLAKLGSTVTFADAASGPLCRGLPLGKQLASWHIALQQAGIKDMHAVSVYIPYPN